MLIFEYYIIKNEIFQYKYVLLLLKLHKSYQFLLTFRYAADLIKTDINLFIQKKRVVKSEKATFFKALTARNTLTQGASYAFY